MHVSSTPVILSGYAVHTGVHTSVHIGSKVLATDSVLYEYKKNTNKICGLHMYSLNSITGVGLLRPATHPGVTTWSIP
jgi:hypothetical protein